MIQSNPAPAGTRFLVVQYEFPSPGAPAGRGETFVIDIDHGGYFKPGRADGDEILLTQNGARIVVAPGWLWRQALVMDWTDRQMPVFFREPNVIPFPTPAPAAVAAPAAPPTPSLAPSI